jgi:hypothetical protein
MLRTALPGAHCVAAALMLVLAGAAFADGYKGPPPAGAMFAARAIVCDTEDQVAEISRAGEGGDVDAVREAYLKWRGAADAAGEPACMDQPVRAIAGRSVALGFSTAADGTRVKTWAVHVGTDEAGAWVLYPEPAAGDDAVAPERQRDRAPRPAATPVGDLCEGRAESTLRRDGARLFWCA